MEKLAAADAAARKLGSADPTVRVGVDSDAAMAKLAAVDAAAQRVNGSQRGLNATNASGVQQWQLIAAAIAALIPLLPALAGYAVGVSGALAGMGAAGVLAIIGITQAVKQGTAEGILYESGLRSLKSVLDQLAQTAATNALNAFSSAVKLINQNLPALNGQIRTFSTILSSAGLVALQGVMNALRILNPLFVTASNYVFQLAEGFRQWTANGGLDKFAADASAAFPQVAQALAAVVGLALKLVEVLSPLGSVILNVLTVAANLASVLLGVLQPPLVLIAAGAAAVWGAFQLWSNIGPTVKDVAETLSLMGMYTVEALGPIGLLGAAIGAAAVAIVGWNVAVEASNALAQAGALAQQDFTAAIIADSGAVAANTAARLQKTLHDSGAIEQAHKLKLSTADLTGAILGNRDALAKTTAATATYANGSKEQEAQMKKTGLGLVDLGLAQETVRQSIRNNTAAIRDGKDAYRELIQVQGQASSTLNENKTLFDYYKDAVDAANSATDKFAKELAGLGQVNLSASEANLQFQQSLADANTALQQNGATLDVNTQKGRDNTKALDDIAASAVSLISAQAKTGASTDSLTGQMASARQSFIDTAMKMGATADQANALADQYGLIPKNVSTAVGVSGVDVAKQKVQDLQNWIDALHGKTVTVQAVANAGVAGQLYAFAKGGTIPNAVHAAGGLTVGGSGSSSVDSVPAVLAPGEEVVSNMNGQASYWRSALKLMNSGNPAAVATEVNRLAGVSSHASASAPIVVTVVNKTGMNLSDLLDIRVERALKGVAARIGASKQKVAY